ncbi:substrate-binding periplasmic protein [Reinekea blandensis]|uniref:ABC-type amino acid transport/signal transduction systems, periplasmic component/domain n=1 Tax=Reinekea blandensis MED297 TaxID=314283 RepID=A4BIB9_9GAMM|nr:transporter substrate-binding domain-containing protein [Reinekea blandensis]EAR08126.1 ABC-type amino acid transport/signal transduction systems, periplasmic component/domain [Reinekea sp. MED297] [Reinekea blandensis MED297]
MSGLIMFGVLVSSAVKAETYTFVSTHFPQLADVDENGELHGLAIELANELFQNIGHEVNIELYPRRRALQMVLDGSAVGLIGPSKTVEREQIFRFGAYPIFNNSQIFYVRTDDPFEWNGDYATLKGRTVAIVLGWGVPKEFEAIAPSLSIEQVETTKQQFLMLTTARVDILLTSNHDAAALFNELNISRKVRRLQPSAVNTPGYFVFAKDRPELEPLIDKIDEELKNMIDIGRVDELQKKYGFSDK